MARIRTEIDGERVLEVEADTVEEAHRLFRLVRGLDLVTEDPPVEVAKPLLRYHFADVNGATPEVIAVAATDYDKAFGIAETEARHHGVNSRLFFESWDCGNRTGISIREGLLSDGLTSTYYRAKQAPKITITQPNIPEDQR